MKVNAKVKAVVFDLDGVYFESGAQRKVKLRALIFGSLQSIDGE